MCHPTVKAWIKYAKFEVKNGEVARARKVYERSIEQLGEDGQVRMLEVLAYPSSNFQFVPKTKCLDGLEVGLEFQSLENFSC